MARNNQYNPTTISHPGETLAEKLGEMQMGVKEFALRTGKPEKTIHAVIKGDSAITSDMAIQFEQVTSIPANFWMNYQARHDEYQARIRHSRKIDAAEEWARSFPVAAMVRMGWIKRQSNWPEKTTELLKFFGIATHMAWAEYYLKKKLKLAFRISLVSTNQPQAISAWLRMGELQAAEIEVGVYSHGRFREVLPQIKDLMAKHPKDFFERLQSLCAGVGVKVVFTPCLPKAPINGSTRWIGSNPLIQLTGRYKRNDIFWFTFFHEAGHILLHGKKDIFLEKVDYSEKDLNKEREADAFAVLWTLTLEQEEAIVSAVPLSDADICFYAIQFNTHPAVIIGRLQHRKLIGHTEGRKYFEKVDLPQIIGVEGRTSRGSNG